MWLNTFESYPMFYKMSKLKYPKTHCCQCWAIVWATSLGHFAWDKVLIEQNPITLSKTSRFREFGDHK